MHRHTTLDGLLDAGIKAAFVHAPTERHAEIVTRLLEADVDVFVDQPLSYSITGSRALLDAGDALATHELCERVVTGL
ncbi:hypothetical protein SUDANB95_04253 [Actinosynnema sp. ALI-1.44]